MSESDREAYLDRLAHIGELTSLSTSTLDVTTTMIDLDYRVDTLNTSISALTTLQGATTLVTDPSVSLDSPHFVQGMHNGWNSLINVFSASITFAGFLVAFLGPIVVLVILIVAINKAIKCERPQN